MKPLLLPVLLATMLSAAPAWSRTWGTLEFTECDLPQAGSGVTTRAECATLVVPEDPAKPDGRTITLKIAMVASRAGEPAPDPVLFIAGGPGQSATESWAQVAGAFSPMRDHRHVLFVDQRGTGGSNALRCEMPEADDAIETLDADASRDAQVAMARDCLASLDGDVAQYTTGVAIQDLEAVRVAIGAPKLNLYGGSYGTRVAQEYARRYPDAVRSLILDGVVPPGLALGGEHAINLESALKAILGECAAQPACATAFGDPYRTLYTLRDRVRAAPVAVTVRDPLTFQPRALRLDESSVVTIARLFAYAPESAALLPLLLDEAVKGRPASLVAQAALIYDSLAGQINHGMQLSVICAEDAPRLARRDEDEDLILGHALVGVTLNQCSVWPKGPVSTDFAEPLTLDVPVLLLSGEFDPVTPPRYAEEVAKSPPRARHLVGTGQGHILLMRGCMPRLAGEFVESLDLDALDASCLEPLTALPFFIDYTGAEP